MLSVSFRGTAWRDRLSTVTAQSLDVVRLIGVSALSILVILLSGVLLGTAALTVDSSTGPRWVQVDLPSLPAVARHRAVVVETEYGETLCAIGGDSKQVYCYPLGANGVPYGVGGGLGYSLDEALRYHAATVVGNRTYVLGGKVGRGRALGDVYCVQRDTHSHTWIVSSGGVMKKKAMQPAAITVGNRIYVIGGCDDGWHYLADVWSADVGTGCVALSEDDWRQEASLRTSNGTLHEISGHAAVSVELNGKNYIYVIGGITPSGSPTNTVLRAEVRGDGTIGSWHDLGSVNGMPGKWLLTAAVSGRYLYVLGGTASLTASTSSAEVYRARIEDDGGLTWLSSPTNLPVPLHAHATAVSKPGRLYVVGGISNGVLQDKLYFTPLLSFDKVAAPDGPVTFDDTINYTLHLTNLGVRDFKTLDITDTVKTNVPTTLDFHLPPECSEYSDDTITCAVPDLTLGNTRDLSFGVTISRPTSALPLAPDTSQVSASASASHFAWTSVCSAARLDTLGVGLSDSNTLSITDTGTIVSDVRVQAAFRTDGGFLSNVTFHSGGVPYPAIMPPSAYSSSVVYEQNVPASDSIGVTFTPVGEVQPDALTAYFLRSTGEGFARVGHTMNQPVYHSAYTDVLKLPVPARSGDVTVKAVVTDDNRSEGMIRLMAKAAGIGREITSTIAFAEPNRGNYLDIRELQLNGVLTTTREITVVAESPSENGESFSLVGLVAETPMVCVLNEATACEVTDEGVWCWDTRYFNCLHVYLPIVLRGSS